MSEVDEDLEDVLPDWVDQHVDDICDEDAKEVRAEDGPDSVPHLGVVGSLLHLASVLTVLSVLFEETLDPLIDLFLPQFLVVLLCF